MSILLFLTHNIFHFYTFIYLQLHLQAERLIAPKYIMKKHFLTITLSLWFTYALAIGEWTVFPTSANYRRGEIFSGRIYLLSGNSLLSADENDLTDILHLSRLTGLSGTRIFDIIVSDKAERLIIVYNDGNIDFLDKDGNVTNLPDFANKTVMGDRSITKLSERDGRLYVSTGFGFLIVNIERAEIEDTVYYNIEDYLDGTYGSRVSTVSDQRLAELNEKAKVNGVGSMSNASLIYSNGILLTANSEDFRSSLFNEPGVLSIYDTYEDSWQSVRRYDIEHLFSDHSAWFQGPTSLAIDPQDNQHFLVGTFSLGILEFMGPQLVNYYNGNNNPGLENILPNSKTTRIGGITMTDDGYAWFMNVGVKNPLRCITPSGDILSFPVNGYRTIQNGFDRLIQTEHNKYRFKWILGIRPWENCQGAIYYDGGTPENPDDDESVSFSTLTDQDGNSYNPKYFNDIAEDKDGRIWLMTSSGPFVFDSQIESFKNPGKVRRVKIPRNDGTNYADYLLGNTDCSCIMIDAANRKWIGTSENGLYVISANGLSQLEHFTIVNSPLPSDNILALAYDDLSGTVYISCEGGIVSYVTDAIKGADDYSQIKCYPNPVRSEYSGALHITGLKDNSKVRICDMSNKVVFSTLSEGGSVTWDLVGESGNRIKAGVYIIYGIDENGKDSIVTKFLVL